MKGYWYIIPVSVTLSFLTKSLMNYWFLGLFLIWLFYLYHKQRLGMFPILLSLIVSLFFTWYIPSPTQLENASPHLLEKKDHQMIGRITSPIVENRESLQFLLKDKSHDNTVQVVYFNGEHDTASATGLLHTLKYGATCEVKGVIEVPDQSTNPGQFNYRQYLTTKGIHYQLVVNQIFDMKCSGSGYMHRVYKLRDNLITYVVKKLPENTSAWLSAIVFGDDSLLPKDTIELFQRWSLSHLLAISGLHVGLVLALLYFTLVRLFGLTKENAQWSILLFLPLYAVLAGGEPSVIRASAMGFVFIALNKLHIKWSVSDVLSFIFLLLLIVDKYIIYQIGFQFSFLVTFGILLSHKWLLQNGSSFFQMLKLSFISQLMILPIYLAYFSTFQPFSILLNMIIVPYFSFFLIPSLFILFILSPVKPIASIISSLVNFLQEYMLAFVTYIDSSFSASLTTGTLPLSITAIYYVFFFLLMKNLHYKNLIKAFGYGILLVVVLLSGAIKPYVSDIGYVTMLDIGQGDAFVLELPYRKGVVLIDAGASFSFDSGEPTEKVYKQVIKPYLLSRGINKIDAIFISHEDTDHNGSLSFIMEEFKVDAVVVSQFYEFAIQDIASLNKSGVELLRLKENTSVEIGGESFKILGPKKDQNSSNANSLVVYGELGGESWLFTGDIGVEEERILLLDYPDLKVDILKVAHHGSNTSTDDEFIQQLRPKYALISAGKNNRYGHPTQEVINTLEKYEITVLRTDQDGAVQFRFKKGNQGTFYRQLP
ncbi:DNA internalization-related competence protein ComEC/Rec2 [Virgibacillus sp. SK37]|uniref:DNA internalization-related competence protein ComEC/Rec2 n=1 Tax=Virgibacillus sp. SK37 TaxID=403957 RepID=UPI0004D1B48A|nr:DNA internalization-related competence protein ComEC/Rec2 [Virgibacillus sp. SK37]AIF43372.1 competence protein [Virgibacillus sp. SK37]